MCARAHVERLGRQDSLVEQPALERCLLDGLEEVEPGSEHDAGCDGAAGRLLFPFPRER